MVTRSSSWPLHEAIANLDHVGTVQHKLQQAPDVIQGHKTQPCAPDIFKVAEKPPTVLQPTTEIRVIPPDETPPQDPVYFFDHYESLDAKTTETFVVKVPWNHCDISEESAFKKCVICEPKSSPGSSMSLLSSYQISLLRKTLLKGNRRGSSLETSFDADSLSKRNPAFEQKTSEFESVASNETKMTECDDRSLRKTLKLKGSPLKRSYSLGYDKSRGKLTSAFKKFSLPTPESQLKEESPKTASESKKVATLYRHYYLEGGWGYVIVSCSILVQILCHGLQMGCGVLLTSVINKFNVDFPQADKTKCHCFKCQPPEKIQPTPKSESSAVIIPAEADSSSRSTLKGRAQSWPLLAQPDGKTLQESKIGAPSPIAQVRRLLWRHYYPEGGWGYVVVGCAVLVQVLNHGLQLAAAVLLKPVCLKFQVDLPQSGWLGALSTAVALFLSPITIAFCRRKSTRVTAVVGGLITALGCLFTSFASQFHQLFFSYGTVIGIGVGLTRDCSTLMVAQYFKRRRELVEIFIVSGSGLGIAVMSACIQGAISAIGWRLGLQAVTGAVFLTFILGTFYRSASLYHPQRRAILHLKNQKRKIKDKNRNEERPTFLDTTTLRSKTVRILLMSTGLSAFGINTPIFYLARQFEEEGLGERTVLLQTYLGIAWVLGCMSFGLVVVHNSVECRIARQYLCQAAIFMCGLAILALTTVHGNYHGYVLFVWIYGIFCGGYHYSLKMYTYERVRARNFARTWGFVQCSQAIPIALGVPISGYMNEGCGGKAGYYFSSTFTLAGSLAMFLIDVHRRRIARHKHTHANGQRHRCESESCPKRRPSIGGAEPEPPEQQLSDHGVAVELFPGAPGEKPELTCISEEGIADMDLPDNLLDDLDYIGITSCNKVENYLMLSEFENNLIAETPVVLDKKGRRWSLARRPDDAPEDGNRWRLVPPKRTITVIDEASV